ncbi:metallophosphoesterase [Roseovarius faecimaris]|uniref:Metallophosphoesterase n=1 Tax=Roseovarius faecimaris TaxID=2494550 RepID=A0A6I6IN99_9RHOB|nr:metallophosphoesterase family protein [Roseovarius faecimaris]QGX98135.1 metallophosphoesterase [Roseovarius faecimaris]
MKLRDLGESDAALLLFGGPYSNLQALDALFEVAGRLGIPPERMICTGDLVAYCADPAEVVARVRAAGIAVVAGNCEKQLAAYEQTCGCGFEAGSACDLLSAGWYAHADARLGAEERAWMGGLPDVISFGHHGRRMAVIHGGISDVSRFLWPTSPDGDFQEEIDIIQSLVSHTSCIFAGHSGLPFTRRIGEVDWINAGAIGLPPHNGAPQTRYALLQDGRITLHKLEYDHDAAARAMRQAGLTQGYDRALISGYWPSEDVLPPDLRRDALSAMG